MQVFQRGAAQIADPEAGAMRRFASTAAAKVAGRTLSVTTWNIAAINNNVSGVKNKVPMCDVCVLVTALYAYHLFAALLHRPYRIEDDSLLLQSIVPLHRQEHDTSAVKLFEICSALVSVNNTILLSRLYPD